MSRESEWDNVRLLSIDMKTKVVQHVESEWMREWKSEIVWECESERETFEHRHENKNWSCPNDQHKHLTYDMWHVKCDIAHVTMWQTVTFELTHENKSCSEHSNIQTFMVPSFCLTFRHFFHSIINFNLTPIWQTPKNKSQLNPQAYLQHFYIFISSVHFCLNSFYY